MVASIATHVPQLNTSYEMRTATLINKIILKSIEANVWYTTHWPTSQRLSSDGESSGYELVARVSYVELSRGAAHVLQRWLHVQVPWVMFSYNPRHPYNHND